MFYARIRKINPRLIRRSHDLDFQERIANVASSESRGWIMDLDKRSAWPRKLANGQRGALADELRTVPDRIRRWLRRDGTGHCLILHFCGLKPSKLDGCHAHWPS